jgi:hypothetical protein
MASRHTATRGAFTLAVLAALVSGLLLSPVGAAFTPTKAKVKKIATKVVKKNSVIGVGDTDTAAGATSVTSQTDPLEINRITFTAPTAGVLLINGSVFMNVTTGGSNRYELSPEVDGQAVAFGASELQSSGAEFTTGYTASVPVAAGQHTITQHISSAATISYNYNGNELTATFHPTGSVT